MIHREKGDSYLKEENTEEKKEEKTEEKPVGASNNEVKEGGTFVVSIEKAPETFNPNTRLGSTAKWTSWTAAFLPTSLIPL